MNLAARLLGNEVNITYLQDFLQQMFFPQENKMYLIISRGRLTSLGKDKLIHILNSKKNVFMWVSTLSRRDEESWTWKKIGSFEIYKTLYFCKRVR